jgi:hypothetical protein
MTKLVNQGKNKPLRDKKGRILPGYTANPNGRPAGTTMKEYIANKFRAMTDEEKEAWLSAHLVSGDTIWRMSEGNPANAMDVTTKGKPIVSLSSEITSKHGLETSSED